MAIDERIDSGIETATMSVERQLERNSKIIADVSSAAIVASTATPVIAERTKID